MVLGFRDFFYVYFFMFEFGKLKERFFFFFQGGVFNFKIIFGEFLIFKRNQREKKKKPKNKILVGFDRKHGKC